MDNIVCYNVDLDIRSVKKYPSKISCHKGECIEIYCNLYEGLDRFNIESKSIKLVGHLYDENDIVEVYRINGSVINNVAIFNMCDVADKVKRGLCEIHIEKEGHIVISQRFTFEVVDSYVGQNTSP